MSRVLMLVPESPLPPRCGNAWRDRQQIALLERQGFEVCLAVLKRRDDLDAGQERDALKKLECRYAPDCAAPRESPAQRMGRKLGYALWSRRHAYAWWTRPYRPAEFFAQVIDEFRPAALLMRSLFLDLLPGIRRRWQGPVIVDCHDADVHLARQAVRAVTGPAKLGPWANLRAVRRCCRSWLPLADEIWAVSSDDAREIGRDAARVPVLVVPSGMERRSRAVVSPGSGRHVLLAANFGYRPNLNAASWLLERIWPGVREALPDARLDLAGGRMPDALRELAGRTAGAAAHGFVPSLDALYEQAALVAVPLLEGGGTRLKLVEAWSRGKAVVTTSKGIEGLPAPPGCALVADRTETFIAGVVRLLESLELRRAIAAAGLEVFGRELTYDAILPRVTGASLLARLRRSAEIPSAGIRV